MQLIYLFHLVMLVCNPALSFVVEESQQANLLNWESLHNQKELLIKRSYINPSLLGMLSSRVQRTPCNILEFTVGCILCNNCLMQNELSAPWSSRWNSDLFSARLYSPFKEMILIKPYF